MQSALKRIRENEVLLGSSVVFIAVVALAATTLLYVHPLGRKTISFETTDASALSTGEDVRVAGISVGKITKIVMQPAAVRVEAEIKDDTFVGSDSRVEIRMLTPVGGYAVTLIPLGNASLKQGSIAADHVSVPYSIGDVLQAAPHVTDKVNGTTIEANIDQVAQALQHNSTSVGSLIAGMNSIATVMDHQRGQVRTIMDLATEYLQTFNGSRDFVFDLIRQIDIVLTTYNNTHVGFNEAYRLLGAVLVSIQPEEKFYLDHKDQVLAAVNKLKGAIADFQTSMGPAIDNLQGLRSQLEAWLTPQGLATIAGGTLSANQICVPIPGRTC
ncbi:MCE family protein [Nocardia sp. ET3-3]|uniref:MCE family protein n=1 Tax=Nocardia terrae TaxID=2675851 RepID=A0A7K1V3L0_9NOCA|nr:MlaD family protein [Nocardia terrae]MVU80728.1 MCE family protein [Nocardia terrae]